MTEAAPATAGPNLPCNDWVPVRKANCPGNIFTADHREWITAAAIDAGWAVTNRKLNWEIEQFKVCLIIRCGDLEATLYPDGSYIMDLSNSNWSAYGLELGDFNETTVPPPEWAPPLQEMKKLVHDLFTKWKINAEHMFRLGKVHMMARKNSVFSAFERITWDQWQLFTLDEKIDPVENWLDHCHNKQRRERLPATATGPCGERLFSIYIAPGDDPTRDDALNCEEECLQWLLGMMRAFPDRRPKVLRELADEAVQLFPGLSKRAFDRSFTRAKTETGNLSWSKAGRPPKTLALIGAKK